MPITCDGFGFGLLSIKCVLPCLVKSVNRRIKGLLNVQSENNVFFKKSILHGIKIVE